MNETSKRTSSRLKILVEAGLMIAIAVVLDEFLSFQMMPNGGSIAIGAIIPIIIFGMRHGVKNALFMGFACGLLKVVIGKMYAAHPLGIILDYIVPFVVMGGITVFGKNMKSVTIGIVVAYALRFVSHVLSGVIVYASYAPEGMNPWIYSMGYNATYIPAEMVVAIIIFLAICKPLQKAKLI